MLRLTDVIQPKPDEHVEAVFRRHRGTLVLPLLGATLLIVIPFFFLFSLTRAGVMGVIILSLLLACGLVLALRVLYAWDANALIVTNQRLIRVTQNGLWNRVVQEASLASLHELVGETKGIWQTLFHIGTLRMRSTGAVGEMIVPNLASPEKARALIERLRSSASIPVTKSSPAIDIDKAQTSPEEIRSYVHALVDKAQFSTLETVKALLEKRVL